MIPLSFRTLASLIGFAAAVAFLFLAGAPRAQPLDISPQANRKAAPPAPPAASSKNPKTKKVVRPPAPVPVETVQPKDQDEAPPVPPRAAEPAPAVEPAPVIEQGQPAQPPGPGPVATDLNGCAPVGALYDRDGDVQRNLNELGDRQLCLKLDVFSEGGLRWIVQIIENSLAPNKWLWVVPHDNEDAAFDTAVYAVKKYGGTMIAIETGGQRNNGPQDPNRNFDLGDGTKCREQVAPSPRYTAHVLERWWKKGTPIIALHTNERGYSGDGQGGAGGISMAKPLPNTLPLRGLRSIGAMSPDDTMVFVASMAPHGQDAGLSQFVTQLRKQGINVMYESVSAKRNDCSLSNYAALKKIRDYFNIEVVHSDGKTQRRLVDLVTSEWPEGGIASLDRKGPAQTPGAAVTDEQEAQPPASAPMSEPLAAGERPVPQRANGSSLFGAPPAPPPPGRTGTGSESGILLQVAAGATEHDAAVAWQERQMQFASLGTYQPIFRAAQPARRNSGYRVLIGPFATTQQAGSFCDQLRSEAARQGLPDPRTICSINGN